VQDDGGHATQRREELVEHRAHRRPPLAPLGVLGGAQERREDRGGAGAGGAPRVVHELVDIDIDEPRRGHRLGELTDADVGVVAG
jgi:hypothetical protein